MNSSAKPTEAPHGDAEPSRPLHHPAFALRATAGRSPSPTACSAALGEEFRARAKGLRDDNDIACRALVDPFNTIRLDRAALRALSLRDAERLLGAACLCAGGGDRPPRGARLRALADRARSDILFTATLGGARIEADPSRLILVRNAGEAARGGLSPLLLAAGQTAVWDGRFELVADRPVMIQALAGKASRLSKPERAALLSVHPSARAGLPVVINPGESVTCPLLAEGSDVRVRPLAGERLAAACGQISRERDLAAARMANPGATPYVGAESYEGDD